MFSKIKQILDSKIGVAGLVALVVILVIVVGPYQERIGGTNPNKLETSDPPATIKANSEYAFNEFKETFAIEALVGDVIRDSDAYERKWLYFAGEVTATRDMTTDEMMGELAVKFDLPDKTTHWAMIRVINQGDVLVGWGEGTDIQSDLRTGDVVELIGFHQLVRSGVPQLALDFGKVRVLSQ